MCIFIFICQIYGREDRYSSEKGKEGGMNEKRFIDYQEILIGEMNILFFFI